MSLRFGAEGKGRRHRGRAAEEGAGAGARGRSSERPRTGAKRTVMQYIQELPNYVRLLFGLLRDGRVSMVDKLLVLAAAVYIVTPLDLIPDFVPFLGEVDDVYLLLLALQRLIANAGPDVLLDHWAGAPEDLEALNVQRAFNAAAFFLPIGIRRKLRRLVKR